jgi:hypothetical protein
MKWADWTTGNTAWPFGTLVPDEVLYEFGGPAIFTKSIGLDDFLFYKSDEYSDGDYFVAVGVTPDEVDALKRGRLSIRGALNQSKCYIFDVDLDLNVRRFEQKKISQLASLLPSSGVPLYANFKTAPDSVVQSTSPLAFKFFGDELQDGLMPLDIFKTLVTNVYDVVRRSFVPPSLSASRAGDLLAFPMRQPVLASLLIAIDHPSIDVGRLRRRNSTKGLDPNQLVVEAEAEGARFVESVERTVDVAMAGKVTKTFARDNFSLFDNINDIVPGEHGDVSKLQLSSYLAGQDVFIELDREVGEKIRFAYKSVRDKSVDITGVIVGMIEKSRSLILRNRFGREVTCYFVPSIYDDLLVRGELVIGRRLLVSGGFQKRDNRDLIKVDGAPKLL